MLSAIPLISVIIPNYKHAPYLRQRIDSVLQQSFQDFELIILDDASPDDSCEIIEEYARQFPQKIKIQFNTKNSGNPFKQWEKGLSLAQGSYIWIAESDDYADTSFLEKCVQVIKSYSDIGIVFAQSDSIDEDSRFIFSFKQKYYNFYKNNIWQQDFQMNGKEYVKKYLSLYNTIPNASAVLFKKELIQEEQLNEYSLRLAGDWLLWIKLIAKTNIAHISERLNYFRQHKKSVRSNTILDGTYFHEYFMIQGYLQQHYHFSPAYRNFISRRLSFTWRSMVAQQRLTAKQHLNILKIIAKHDKTALKEIVNRLIIKQIRAIRD